MEIKKYLQEIISNPLLLDLVAYQINEKSYTYRDLLLLAEDVRIQLEHQNEISKIVAPIIVYGHKQVEMVSCFIGCNAAGVAFIPVDISTPIERIKKIIDISKTKHIFAISPLNINQNIHIFPPPKLTGESHQLVKVENYVSGTDISYILFTSGTTGLPKGVPICIEALNEFVSWSLGLVEETKLHFINHSIFSFDVSFIEIWTSISSFGKIIALDSKNNHNPRANFQVMKQANPQVWVSTPSFIEQMLQIPTLNYRELSKLKIIFLIGETLHSKTAAEINIRFPYTKLYNLYGPTETTIAVTSLEVTAEVIKTYPQIPVGSPRPNTEVFIDYSRHPDGEVAISGKCVSPGYLNSPEQSMTAFCIKHNKHTFLTGDAGFFDQTGMLFLNGRIDHQVKLKGNRIELQEIDILINKLISCRGVCSVAVSDEKGKVVEIVAVIASDNSYTQQELKEQMMLHVPSYMIPAKIVNIHSMPITSNGKIDRKEINNIIKQYL